MQRLERQRASGFYPHVGSSCCAGQRSDQPSLWSPTAAALSIVQRCVGWCTVEHMLVAGERVGNGGTMDVEQLSVRGSPCHLALPQDRYGG